VIYLDHAATSWPKPPEVAAAMADFLERAGGSPGRSAHRLSIAAGRTVYEAREAVASLFGMEDPARVLFTSGATHAVNLALFGLLRPGDRVVTGSVEHNAVRRPLTALAERGVVVVTPPGRPDGSVDLDAIAAALRPGARLLAVNHASNVCGTIAPLPALASLAHAAGAIFLVDAAQTAGVLPFSLAETGADLLAFTGHKGLHGPPGTGGLLLSDGFDPELLTPLLYGGTGSRSDSEAQPGVLPDRFESGTPNGVGLAGLAAGIGWVRARGLEAIRAHEVELAAALGAGLAELPGVTVQGPREPDARTAVLSFTAAGRTVSEIGGRLDDEHGVLCRVGLHCAPLAHRTLGSFPGGSVRFAPGPLTTLAEARAAVAAVAQVLRR